MRIPLIIFIGAALLPLVVAASASGQEHSGAVGYGVGAIQPGDLGPQLALEAGWLATAQAEQWLGSGRVGVRGTAGFTQRPFRVSGESRDINTWLFDASLLLRPLPARAGRSVVPFLSAGGGVVSYGFGEGPPVHLAESGAVYPGDSDRRLALAGGVGLDLLSRLSLFDTPLGIRLEVADLVTLDSPFEPAEGGSFGPVHNLRFTIGLLGLVSLPR